MRMTWHVQYRTTAKQDRISRYPSPEVAVRAACRLIDEGFDVYAIGTGPLADSIGIAEIVKIYNMWKKAHPSLLAASAAETGTGGLY